MVQGKWYSLQTKRQTIDLLSVLELGAGAALPSMISALQDARLVVATDYPDSELIQMLERNIAKNCGDLPIQGRVGFHEWKSFAFDIGRGFYGEVNGSHCWTFCLNGSKGSM